MKNIKVFYKEHKNKIVFVGGMIVSAVIGALAYKQLNPVEEVVDSYKGKAVISWIPDNKIINLERAKTIMDLNADNTDSYAIFKEGVNSDEYTCVVFSEDGIIDVIESEEA